MNIIHISKIVFQSNKYAINAEIQTNQVGNDYTCSCIYHNDPHPSMHIYTQSNSFYCFECNKGGNLFNFIEDKLNCNFNESIQWLENEYPDLLKEKPVWNLRTESNYQRSGYQIAYETYQKMTPDEEEKFHEFVIKRGYTEDFLTQRDIFYAKGKNYIVLMLLQRMITLRNWKI